MFHISESSKQVVRVLCELGPLMRIEPYNYQYVHVQPEDCKEIVERTILEGLPVERLFYRIMRSSVRIRTIFRS